MRTAVFVLGVPRSGTTLVNEHLCRFENAAFLPRSLRVLERCHLRWAHPLARPMALMSASSPNLNLDWHQHDGGELFWRSIARGKSSREVRELLQRYVVPGSNGDRVFLNKRIANIEHLPLIVSLFERSVLVHVVRDPVDTVQSLLNRRKQVNGSIEQRWGPLPPGMPHTVDEPIRDCALQYKLTYQAIEDARSMFTSAVSIRYTEYCSEPERTVRRIAALAGLAGEVPRAGNVTARGGQAQDSIRASVRDVLGAELFSELTVDSEQRRHPVA